MPDGWTKLHAEDYVRYVTERNGLDSVIVRLFNVIGPGDTNPHVVPEIVRQLRLGRRRIALGNVDPKRDYVHVDDVADGLVAVALPAPDLLKADGPDVVNLGTGRSYSVRELLQKLSAIVGHDLGIDVDRARVRSVDRPELVADSARLRERFGWTPRRDIDASLQSVWDDSAELPRGADPAS